MKIEPNKDFDLMSAPKYYFLSMCEVDCNFEMIGKELSLMYWIISSICWEKHISILHNKFKSYVKKFYFLSHFG